jgi:hypothetical protein
METRQAGEQCCRDDESTCWLCDRALLEALRPDPHWSLPNKPSTYPLPGAPPLLLWPESLGQQVHRLAAQHQRLCLDYVQHIRPLHTHTVAHIHATSAVDQSGRRDRQDGWARSTPPSFPDWLNDPLPHSPAGAAPWPSAGCERRARTPDPPHALCVSHEGSKPAHATHAATPNPRISTHFPPCQRKARRNRASRMPLSACMCARTVHEEGHAPVLPVQHPRHQPRLGLLPWPKHTDTNTHTRTKHVEGIRPFLAVCGVVCRHACERTWKMAIDWVMGSSPAA